MHPTHFLMNPEKNPLYPIFLKTTQLQILIVGGGYVALEKMEFLFKSSPNSSVTLVAPMLREETSKCVNKNKVVYMKGFYNKKHLEGKHLVIATTDQPDVNLQVYNDCRAKNILINVADNPPLCDFYMGGIVTKGNLKIAISTNAKSPTMAKRIRQYLEDFLPDQMDELLEKLHTYRNKLKGDFEEKVEAMNELTKKMMEK